MAALNQLCENNLKSVGDKVIALPFYGDGESDIGETIELLWCIIRDRNVFKLEKKKLKKITNCIANPSTRETYGEFE